ncbi:MAG: LOG family protein, partial [Calditrichaeota bacterium]|nr:LOG family protein [Calditrichota bacterium]
KPIILLNINGYYDPLQALFEHLFAQNFANPNYRKVYYFSDSVADAFAYLDRYHMEHRA